MRIEDCGLSPATLKALKHKNIETAEQFMEILPVEYRDFNSFMKIAECRDKTSDVLVKGRLKDVSSKSGRPAILTAYLEEVGTGELFKATWFGQPYRERQISSLIGKFVAVGGQMTFHPIYGYQFNSPGIFQEAESFPLGIYPKYRKITGVSEEMMNTLHDYFGMYISENMEFPIIAQYGLLDKKRLYGKIHFPATDKDWKQAMKELRFRELLYFAVNLKNNYPKVGTGIKFKDTKLAEKFVSQLPFSLTDGQTEAVDTIRDHTLAGRKLHMLIQGDVGCGKTVTAFYAMFLAAGNGKQAVLAAPTNVLAGQHYISLCEYVDKLGEDGLNVAFIHSGMKAAEKRQILEGIKKGTYNLIVGTHSVFSDICEYKDLALAIIDEEHRFGVKQRETLKEKSSGGAHIINMSATPIPRSLASILYGEGCEVVSIKDMPAGRLPVLSAQCKTDDMVFRFVGKQLSEGRQCYVVCPLVNMDDESEKQSVEEVTAKYQKSFPNYKVESVHGKMKKQDVEDVLERFRTGKTQVLIATTVIEVGVNIPNANVIVIENAELYGLATLHQLRGRVGRGKYQSYCILKSEKENNPRIEALLKTKDGFKIAEEDMKLRGTGDLLGIDQTGFNRYISMILDYPDEYKKASEAAEWILKNGFTNLLMTQ